MKKGFHINSPLLQLVMYALLLFFTPFIMLRNFMQEAIANLSKASFCVFEVNIPYILLLAVVSALGIAFVWRRHITKYRFAGLIAVLLLIIIGQNSTDYYFNHKFYELQHNWHYFAYGIFAYMMYRTFKPRNVPASKIILFTIIFALCISTLDEIVQIFISNRVFDICDIGKDLWGAMAGTVGVYFVGEEGKIVQKNWRIRQKNMLEYLRNPLSILVLGIVFSYIFLVIGSLLSESQYVLYVVGITLVLFALFFVVFHLSQRRALRFFFATCAIIILLAQSVSLAIYYDENIIYNSFGLTIYKGIPIPFFDVLIRPNGTFRLVDKKHAFNQRDMQFFHSHAEDILLIGSGAEGRGGKGFHDIRETFFIFNPVRKQGLQVIIQKTPKACETFNRLKSKGKNVLFILHNTC